MSKKAIDPEIRAMLLITNALAPLDEDAKWRVIEWLCARHQTLLAPVTDVGSAQVQVIDNGSGKR